MAGERRHFVCVICPMGCEIDVVHDGSKIISLAGNKCDRSEEFLSQELLEPMRTLTTTVRIRGSRSPLVPVRTDKSVPRRLFPIIMRKLRRVSVQAPVNIHDVVVRDVMGTGANVIATRSMPSERGGR